MKTIESIVEGFANLHEHPEEGPQGWGVADCEIAVNKITLKRRAGHDWQSVMRTVESTLRKNWQERAGVETLGKELQLLKSRVAALEEAPTLRIPVQSLAPEPYEVVRPFEVVVRRCGDEFIATFFDANLSASGESDTEAFSNLKDIIVGTMEALQAHTESELGNEVKRQLEVLKSFMRKTD